MWCSKYYCCLLKILGFILIVKLFFGLNHTKTLERLSLPDQNLTYRDFNFSTFDLTEEFAFRKEQLILNSTQWKKIRINPDSYDWLIIDKNFCTDRYPNIKALIFVYTAPIHVKERIYFRQMYGDKLYSKLGIVTLFLLGKPTDEKLQDQIQAEAFKYRDILQQNFWDTYETLSFKGAMMLKFVSEYCPDTEYVIKTDDDTVLNMYKIMDILEKQNAGFKQFFNTKRSFICPIQDHIIPSRNVKSKWYTSINEYPEKKFPDYCRGLIYIFPGFLAKEMFKVIKQAVFRKFEDLYITAEVAQMVGNVTYNDIRHLVPNGVIENPKNLFLSESFIAAVEPDRELAIEMWRDLSKKRYNLSL